MKLSTRRKLSKILIMIALVLAVIGVHRMSYDDEITNALYNCKMVERGIWPEHFCQEKKK